jgi:hypothetical protein
VTKGKAEELNPDSKSSDMPLQQILFWPPTPTTPHPQQTYAPIRNLFQSDIYMLILYVEFDLNSDKNCQTYNPSNCPSSIQFLYTCIAKAGGTFDSLIQYLNFNNFNSDGSIFSKPNVQSIFQPYMCGTEGQGNYNFLLCYDINCSKLLSQTLYVGRSTCMSWKSWN